MPKKIIETFGNVLKTPLHDVLGGLERCLESSAQGGPRQGYRELGLIGLGLLAGWWVYVPVHELLHASGCLVTGGSVTRLEIARIYGGDLWAALFPFVVPGGEYAGRLSGFDTGGRDLVYLATAFAPYLLTVFPGVWALRRSARRAHGFAFGFVVPVALAPFVSLTGDAYEIGAILVTRLPAWAVLAETLRGDDVLRLVSELRGRDDAPWGGVAMGWLAGLAWAFLTYATGALAARRFGEEGRKAPRP